MPIPNNLSKRQQLQARFKGSRNNLLLVVAFTVINTILLVTNSDTYFLFSAYIPYVLVFLGMSVCGMLPAEYYGEEFSQMEFVPSSAFAVFLVIAVVIIALYFLAWLFSKKNRIGWMIFALVFFAIDTIGMFVFMNIGTDTIIDVAFHIWVIVSLVLGVIACSKLKKLPPEEELDETQAVEDEQPVNNSNALRIADPDVKSRVLLEANAVGHAITYRRVKRVNELVIDGYVYDEYEAVVEVAHSLKAQIDSHSIEVGYDGINSYLNVDGQRVAKKLRIY